MHFIKRSAFFVVALLFIGAQLWADKGDHATESIRMMPPAKYPLLTREMIDVLAGLDCKIPQPWSGSSMANVIVGHFAATSQTDVAVLCSRQGKSAIYILWGGPRRCPAHSPSPATLAQYSDRSYLQMVGPEKIGYSRAIVVADNKAVRRAWINEDVVSVPELLHDGIEDAYLEKGSTIHYCSEGRWLALPGSD